MRRRLKLVYVGAVVATITILLLPAQVLAITTGSRVAGWIPVLWHRIICRAIGVRITRKGSLERSRPLLMVSNHVSWSDILVFGSLAPVTFIAKQEVARIPGANLLARLQRTVFVERERRHHSGHQAQQISERLLKGDAVLLFAEGTTGTGNRVLDFKSALFGSAQFAVRQTYGKDAHIQPVAIRYSALHGIPLGRKERARASWTGDETLGPHLSAFVTSGHWDVEVHFGLPFPIDETSRRQKMAHDAQLMVRDLLNGKE